MLLLAGTGDVLHNVLLHQWAIGQAPVTETPELRMGATVGADEEEPKALLPSSSTPRSLAASSRMASSTTFFKWINKTNISILLAVVAQ